MPKGVQALETTSWSHPLFSWAFDFLGLTIVVACRKIQRWRGIKLGTRMNTAKPQSFGRNMYVNVIAHHICIYLDLPTCKINAVSQNSNNFRRLLKKTLFRRKSARRESSSEPGKKQRRFAGKLRRFDGKLRRFDGTLRRFAILIDARVCKH